MEQGEKIPPPLVLAANNVARALPWSYQSNLPKLDTTFCVLIFCIFFVFIIDSVPLSDDANWICTKWKQPFVPEFYKIPLQEK